MPLEVGETLPVTLTECPRSTQGELTWIVTRAAGSTASAEAAFTNETKPTRRAAIPKQIMRPRTMHRTLAAKVTTAQEQRCWLDQHRQISAGILGR